jgi:hypothetical protein
MQTTISPTLDAILAAPDSPENKAGKVWSSVTTSKVVCYEHKDFGLDPKMEDASLFRAVA